jgi:hypothetical protein
MMQQRLEAAFDGLAGLVAREPDDAPAVGDEGGVSGAVLLKGRAGAVGLPAVGLDDDPVPRPREVGVQARVVRGSEGGV